MDVIDRDAGKLTFRLLLLYLMGLEMHFIRLAGDAYNLLLLKKAKRQPMNILEQPPHPGPA